MPFMPDVPAKKNATLTLVRSRPFLPKIVLTTGFRLRFDKATNLIDIFLESAGQKGERVVLDPVVIQNNNEHLTRFVAAVPVDPDEKAVREDVITSEQMSYANVIYMSRIATRGETVFGCFSLLDWVNEGRQATRKNGEITSIDLVVAASTASLQKKLILELALLIEQI